MNGNSLGWALGIIAMFIVGTVIVIAAVWRYLAETAPEDDTPPDPELEREIERRVRERWKAITEEIGWGPCRYCGTPDEECVPFSNPCCNRCAGDPNNSHPAQHL